MSPQGRPLKILHIASGDLWAGAEVQAFTLLSALQVMAGLELRAVLMNDGELARRLRGIGIAVTVFDEARLNGWQIFRALRRELRSWSPDIVHTHRTKENVLGALANRCAGYAPSVRTVHGAPEHAPRGLRQLHKRLFRALDIWTGRHLQQRIIAVSTDLAEKLAALYPRARIALIANGIDIEQVQAAVEPAAFPAQQQPAATHIGIVGRLVPVKRVDLFLEMAQHLRRQAPERNWRFHVFGDGPLLAALTARAAALGLSDCTVFHGHRGDIATCIAGLDALVMCSDHEGLPMTALETLAVGTPLAAHAVGGLAHLLEGNAGGLLTTDHTGAGYAQTLLSLLSEDRSRLVQRGRARLAEQYSASGNAAATLRLYRELHAAANRG